MLACPVHRQLPLGYRDAAHFAQAVLPHAGALDALLLALLALLALLVQRWDASLLVHLAYGSSRGHKKSAANLNIEVNSA
jgi:hypothetical protein